VVVSWTRLAVLLLDIIPKGAGDVREAIPVMLLQVFFLIKGEVCIHSGFQ